MTISFVTLCTKKKWVFCYFDFFCAYCLPDWYHVVNLQLRDMNGWTSSDTSLLFLRESKRLWWRFAETVFRCPSCLPSNLLSFCCCYFYCCCFVIVSNLCTGVPAVPPSSNFSDHPSPLLLQPCKCAPLCPPPPPPCRPRDRLELSQLQQYPGHRLLQDPLETQPHRVHHMDDQLPLLARLPGRLRRARPRGAGEGSETSFSPPVHSHHIQVSLCKA